MSNPLDTAADWIANLLSRPDPFQPVTEEPISLQPLPPPTDPIDAVSVGRGFADLARFVLPGFRAFNNPANPIYSGNSFNCLQKMPRTPQTALRIQFPDPIYGIWLDPFWTTPGAMVAVSGSGSNRSNFFVLTRGKGIKFTQGIQSLQIFNADCLEQLYLPTTNLELSALLPFGYASFLIALNPNSNWEGDIPVSASNVSTAVQTQLFNVPPAVNTYTPVDGFPMSRPVYPLSALCAKAFILECLGINAGVGIGPSIGSWSMTFQTWFLSSFSTLAIGTPAIPVSDDVWGPDWGERWVRGPDYCASCNSKGGTGADSTRNCGSRLIVPVPSNTLAMVIGLEDAIVGSDGNTQYVQVNTNVIDK